MTKHNCTCFKEDGKLLVICASCADKIKHAGRVVKARAKVPEKLEIDGPPFDVQSNNITNLAKKLNQIIDYLNSQEEK